MSNKFNPDWLRRYNISLGEDEIMIEWPDGEWVRSKDHDRFIMEQAAEYQEIIKKLEAELSKAKRCGSCKAWEAAYGICRRSVMEECTDGCENTHTCDKWEAI